MQEETKRPGQKPQFRGVALTQAEKTRRQRMKERTLREGMLKDRSIPLTLFVNQHHINALSLLSARLGGPGRLHENPVKASEWVWRAIKHYVEDSASRLNPDNPIDKALIDLLNSDMWPQTQQYEARAADAMRRFNEWSAQEFGEAPDKEGGSNVD